MHRSKPEISGNDIADEIEAGNRRYEVRQAVVRRACEVMGWTYSESPVLTGIRKVVLGEAVAVSVEKLHELLDRISPRSGLCEHGVPEGDWCEPCNRAYKDAEKDPTNDVGTAQTLTCANCGEVSTNPGQFIPDGRWLCTEACRKELCDMQSYGDLAASGGIVDAP